MPAAGLSTIARERVLYRSERISSIPEEALHREARRQERAWVKAAQAGSTEAIEALFRRHWRPAYRAAYLIVQDAAAAEDIAQEAFLSALRSLERFDRRRPFAPWLHRIVINRAIDWSRARSLRRELGDATHEEPAFSPPPASEPPSEILVSALRSLSPEQRAVVVLRFLLDYTPGEIADVLGFPRGTVNSRLRRGLDRLAQQLRGEGES
jgi:RNA polymerase sigma-70 factor (ECF subfamily)